VAGAVTVSATVRADQGTSNSPVDNPLRQAAVTVVDQQESRPVRMASHQDRPASGSGKRLQWRTLRQPGAAEEAVEAVEPAQEDVATAELPQRKPIRQVAAQQPAEERSVLPSLPGEEAKESAPAPAPRRPYLDPAPGAAEQPPTQLAPMPLPLTEGEAQKLDEKIAYDCKAAREELRRKKLSDISLDIEVRARKGFEVPHDCEASDAAFEARHWECTDFAWTASGLCHKPLYFEERHLERYGHATGPYTQPLLSGAHFYGSVLMLPWNMGLKLPNECVYALGHYEPGDCSPYMIPALPITARAALFQAGAAAGLIYLLP